MNNRIAEVRKHFGLTQAEFGAKIGLSRDGVASYERGNAKPTGVALQCIVSVFHVNKHWLETGEGDMLDGAPDLLEALREKHMLSPVAFGIVKSFVEMDGPQREQLLTIARKLFSSADSVTKSIESAARRSGMAASEIPNINPVEENQAAK